MEYIIDLESGGVSTAVNGLSGCPSYGHGWPQSHTPAGSFKPIPATGGQHGSTR
jgi:hypothetical protein